MKHRGYTIQPAYWGYDWFDPDDYEPDEVDGEYGIEQVPPANSGHCMTTKQCVEEINEYLAEQEDE